MKEEPSVLSWTGLGKLAAEIRASGGPGSNEWDMAASHTKRFNDAFVKALRENKGKIPGELESAPGLIITTTGAKTGKQRTVPLVCQEIEGRLLIMASMGGSERNPPWFHNLVRNPEVLVEKDGESFTAQAVVIEGEQRDRLFKIISENLPPFADYQSRTKRQIPVVELKR